MYRRTWVLAALLAAACGRSGFGEVQDGRVTDGTNGSSDASDTGSGSNALLPIEMDLPTAMAIGSAFTPVMQLDIPPSPATQWAIFFSASLDSSTQAEVGVEIRYLVDGTVRGFGGTQSSLGMRPGPWQSFYAVTGRETSIPISVELHEAAGGKATVGNLRVVALPLPAGADLQFQTDDPPRTITTTSFTTTSTFTLTPASAGDYVVFTLVNASDAPSQSDSYIQWRAGANLYLGDTQQPRQCAQSMLTAWRQTLSSAPFNVTLETQVGGGMSTVSYARVLAVRADAFPTALVKNKQLPFVMTLQATPVTVDELQTTAPAGSHFLYLASVRLAESCGPPVPTTFADRIAHFAVDGVETSSIDHRAANCAYQTTYGTVQLLQTAPTRLTTSISSGNAKEVDADESSIVLLGLP